MKQQAKFFCWCISILLWAVSVWAVFYKLAQGGQISWWIIAGLAVAGLVLYLLQYERGASVDIGEYKGKKKTTRSRFFWGCSTEETGEEKRKHSQQ